MGLSVTPWAASLPATWLPVTVCKRFAVRSALMLFGLLRLTGYASEPLLDRDELHAVVGEPTRVLPTSSLEPRDVTVVSWNIARGTRYERVLDALRAMPADIYLLQEVDLGCRRSDYREVARELAHELGLNWVFAGEFQEIGEGRGNRAALTGQAVLSRFPIEDPAVIRFARQANMRWKLDPFQPRRGGRVALRVESAGVVTYNAHIESAKNDAFRFEQVRELVLDHQMPARHSLPVVIAGDLNTGPDADSPVVMGLVREGFADALGSLDAPRRTSARHAHPLDWIFVRNLTSTSGGVIDVPRASDHFPLRAALALLPRVSLADQ